MGYEHYARLTDSRLACEEAIKHMNRLGELLREKDKQLAERYAEIERLRSAASGLVTAAKIAVDCHEGELYEPEAFEALQDHIDGMEKAIAGEEE